MEKLIKNTIIKTYCLRHCCQGTPTRAVHAKGGAIPINTKVKSEDTEIPDSGNHRLEKTPTRNARRAHASKQKSRRYGKIKAC